MRRLLVVALMALLALVPLAVAADEPPPADEATIFGLTRQQAIAVGVGVGVVGGAVVLTAATGGGIPTLLAALYVGHWAVEASIVGFAGAGFGGFSLWQWGLGTPPPPAVE
ncbi:MAG: hypothetical protein ACT4P2_16570 [Pseudomonadota bacterium]